MALSLSGKEFIMPVNKLKHTPDDFSEVTLIGITTSLKDYRLAYFINKETNLNLERLDDLPVFDEKSKQLNNFSFYRWYDDDQRVSYYIISNEHPNGRMISTFQQADYFLIVKGKTNDSNLKQLQSILRSIPSVTFVFNADINKIKELTGILYDLELHELSQVSRQAAN